MWLEQLQDKNNNKITQKKDKNVCISVQLS